MSSSMVNRKAISTTSSSIRKSSLLGTATTFERAKLCLYEGKSTSSTLSTAIKMPALSSPQIEEAGYDEVMALFSEIEPDYSATNRKLANL